MGDSQSSSSPSPRPPWPDELVEVFERSVTAEFATLTRAGTTDHRPDDAVPRRRRATIDVSTGLTYPAKAERARRDPRVCLLFADPVGGACTTRPSCSSRASPPSATPTSRPTPTATCGRAWPSCPTPPRASPGSSSGRWPGTTRASGWTSPRSTSDGGRTGRSTRHQTSGRPRPARPRRCRIPRPAAASRRRGDRQAHPWRERGRGRDRPPHPPRPHRGGRQRLPPVPARRRHRAHLGGVRPAPRRRCARDRPGSRMPDDAHPRRGVHGPGEPLVRRAPLAPVEGAVAFGVERALADWSLGGGRAKVASGFLGARRRLAPRLRAEAARRSQPVPKVRFP